MKRLSGYRGVFILLTVQILVAPVLAVQPARATVDPANAVVERIISAESEKIQDMLWELMDGRCFSENSCPAQNDKVISTYGVEMENLITLPTDHSPGSGSNSLVLSGNREKWAEGEKKSEVLSTTHRFQTITHLMGSHLGIVTRPVTAGKRLFFLVYDTLKDAIGWPAISARGTEEALEDTGAGSMDLASWERRLDEITGSGTSYGTVDFLVDGDEYFPRFLDAVENARRAVKIRTYIFDNDDYALKIAEILKRRSKEIDIRILMDGLGTIMATGVAPETLPAGYVPPPSVREFLTKGSRIRVRQQFNPWFTGDHAKTVIVDDRKAFVGGDELRPGIPL